jgi:hypothetical protein
MARRPLRRDVPFDAKVARCVCELIERGWPIACISLLPYPAPTCKRLQQWLSEGPEFRTEFDLARIRGVNRLMTQQQVIDEIERVRMAFLRAVSDVANA